MAYRQLQGTGRTFQAGSGAVIDNVVKIMMFKKQQLELAALVAWICLCTASCQRDQSDGMPKNALYTEPEQLLAVRDLLLPQELSRDRQEGVTVDTIMIHFISNAVRQPESPYSLEQIIEIMKEYKVSSHYLVARDGQVFKLVSENRISFHAGKGELPWSPGRKDRLNDFSIGIELMGIGTKEEMKPFISSDHYDTISKSDLGFTKSQYNATKRLIADIRNRWPTIELDGRHIVGHDEYAIGRKTDPGTLFDWSQIGIRK